MIHKEGTQTLLVSFLFFALINLFSYVFFPVVLPYLLIASIGIFGFLISFFRNPERLIPELSDSIIYAPADGKVVVIEEVEETEFLHKKVRQISIFMSPLNVHVNRNPISADVIFAKHHEGKFLPAWDPKASTENERTTCVYKKGEKMLLMRQVAGALAKRIVFYSKEGDKAVQGEDMGFIKFGSRVDLYMPLDAEVLVKIDDVVKGNLTEVARW